MKKFLWVIVVLIVLGAGFFYFSSKNPELTKGITSIWWPKYVVPNVNPADIPERCGKYFDGCNTCTIENGKATCTETFCDKLQEPRCLDEVKPSDTPVR